MSLILRSQQIPSTQGSKAHRASLPLCVEAVSPAQHLYLRLILSVFDALPSTVTTISTSPFPAKEVGMMKLI